MLKYIWYLWNDNDKQYILISNQTSKTVEVKVSSHHPQEAPTDFQMIPHEKTHYYLDFPAKVTIKFYNDDHDGTTLDCSKSDVCGSLTIVER